MKKINTKLTMIIIGIIIIIAGLFLILNNIGKVKHTTYIDITYDEVMAKIDNEESFIIFLYQTGCSHCESFEPKLNNVITKYNLEIFSINLKDLTDEQYSKLENKTFVSGTPTTVYFEKGKKKDKLTGDKDESKLIKFLIDCGYIKED